MVLVVGLLVLIGWTVWYGGSDTSQITGLDRFSGVEPRVGSDRMWSGEMRLDSDRTTVQLRRAGSLQLRFVDSLGRGLAGIRVVLGPTKISSSEVQNLALRQIPWQQVTDSRGLVEWDELPRGIGLCYSVVGEQAVRYQPPGAGATGSGRIVLRQPQTSYQVLIAGADILGRLPPGIQVETKLYEFVRLGPRCRSFLGSTRIAAKKLCTSNTGEFRFERVPGGSWLVRAQWREGKTHRFASRFCEMPSPQVDVDLGVLGAIRGRELSCRVRLREAIDGAEVQPGEICDGPLTVVVTVDSGWNLTSEADFGRWVYGMVRARPGAEFVLSGLDEGPCHLLVQHWHGRLRAGVSLEPDRDGLRVDISDQPSCEIFIAVRRARSNTLRIDCSEGDLPSGASTLVVLAAADGRRTRAQGSVRDGWATIRCSVPVGRYRLYASADHQGRRWAAEIGVHLAGGRTVITLRETQPVTLRLLSASGTPLVEFEVAYGFSGWAGGAYVTTVCSDSEGRCTLHGIPPGRTLRLRGRGRFEVEPIEVPDGILIEIGK